MLTDIFIQMLETTINRYLSLDDTTAKRLKKLQGKIAKIVFKHTHFVLYLQFTADHVYLLSTCQIKPDVTIESTPLTFMNFWQKNLTNKNTVDKNIEITGDVELAEAVNNLFRELDIDWEAQFAKLFGDVFAHQLAQMHQTASEWFTETKSTIEKNFTEYVQEEKHILPTPDELNYLLSSIDTLQHDVARVEAKVNRLFEKVSKHKDTE